MAVISTLSVLPENSTSSLPISGVVLFQPRTPEVSISAYTFLWPLSCIEANPVGKTRYAGF